MKKSMIMAFAAFLIMQFPYLTSYGQTDVYSRLAKGFKNPPAKAQPIVYHWWLGGNVDTLRLRDEFKSMKDAGISGFTIFEIGSRDTVMVKAGPAFLGDESLKVLKFAVDEAGRLGLEV
jgi:hypothetical protein